MKPPIDRFTIIVACIILLGCVIRLIACLNTCIINNDGVLYIQQARALYYGESGGLTSELSYFSLYPFFIAGAYYLAGDWIVSALGVSWFFGSATLFPVFLLLRRFFDRSTTGLGLLLFAVMPVFVDISCAVIKEPVAYFFAAWGFHFFLRHMESGGIKVLVAAGFCFLMASWARVEILMIFAASGVCLLFFSPRRWAAVGTMAVFLAVVSGAVAVAGMVAGLGLTELFRSGDVISNLRVPFSEYRTLRAELRELAVSYEYPKTVLSLFFEEARGLVWFIALGGMLKCFVKALFYPMALFFVFGLPRAWKLVRSDKRILYLTLAAAAGFILFYVHEVRYWIVYPRLLALVIIPTMYVLTCGLGVVKDFLRTRLKIRQSLAAGLLALVLVFSTLPKNIGARECDKLVFRDIGEAVAAFDGGAGPFTISASAANQRWVPFYANLGVQGAFHPGIFMSSWEYFPGHTMEELLYRLYNLEIAYLLWDEKNWGDKRFPLYKLLEFPGVQSIGQWSHPDTGKMILLKLPGKFPISDVDQLPLGQ